MSGYSQNPAPAQHEVGGADTVNLEPRAGAAAVSLRKVWTERIVGTVTRVINLRAAGVSVHCSLAAPDSSCHAVGTTDRDRARIAAGPTATRIERATRVCLHLEIELTCASFCHGERTYNNISETLTITAYAVPGAGRLAHIVGAGIYRN